MRVKATKAFYDKAEETMRHEGEAFDVTVKRLSEINGAGFGVLAAEDMPVMETPELKKKKPSRR